MLANLHEIGLDHGEFDALVNGLDVERRKPFPDIFLKAASLVSADPQNCWVVEDAIAGVQAAKAAGMRCLALLTTFPEKDLREAGADIVVRDLASASLEACCHRVPPHARILIVDDSFTARTIMKRLIGGAHDLAEASSGETALAG
jgi:beta-phosphoglucomutase-like phosphatase (HAD superfamily)